MAASDRFRTQMHWSTYVSGHKSAELAYCMILHEDKTPRLACVHVFDVTLSHPFWILNKSALIHSKDVSFGDDVSSPRRYMFFWKAVHVLKFCPFGPCKLQSAPSIDPLAREACGSMVGLGCAVAARRALGYRYIFPCKPIRNRTDPHQQDGMSYT